MNDPGWGNFIQEATDVGMAWMVLPMMAMTLMSIMLGFSPAAVGGLLFSLVLMANATQIAEILIGMELVPPRPEVVAEVVGEPTNWTMIGTMTLLMAVVVGFGAAWWHFQANWQKEPEEKPMRPQPVDLMTLYVALAKAVAHGATKQLADELKPAEPVLKAIIVLLGKHTAYETHLNRLLHQLRQLDGFVRPFCELAHAGVRDPKRMEEIARTIQLYISGLHQIALELAANPQLDIDVGREVFEAQLRGEVLPASVANN